MVEISDMQSGKAGEYLVCADLIIKGYVAFPSEQGLPYDVVVDTGKRLLRIQVKTTRTHKALDQRKNHTPTYLFNIRKMGKGGRGVYTSDQVDIFALVALDTRIIGYLPEKSVRSTMNFRIPENKGKYYDELKRDRSAIIMASRKEGITYAGIAKSLNMNIAQVHKIATGQQGAKRFGIYLDEISFESALKEL